MALAIWLFCSTWALYCEYMGFVLRVYGFCTASTWALYSKIAIHPTTTAEIIDNDRK